MRGRRRQELRTQVISPADPNFRIYHIEIIYWYRLRLRNRLDPNRNVMDARHVSE